MSFVDIEIYFDNNLFLFLLRFTTRRRGDGLSFKQILQTLDDVVDEKELMIFATVGWGLVPVTEFIYELFANVTGRGIDKKPAPAPTKKEKKSKIREAYESLTPWDDDKLEGEFSYQCSSVVCLILLMNSFVLQPKRTLRR